MVTSRTVAKAAHEANRAYCQGIGDYSQPPWEQTPEWQKESAIAGVEAHLNALAEGRKLSPRESHDEWLHHKLARGWKLGPAKDANRKEHPCMVPFDDLPVQQRVKDYIFSALVGAIYEGFRATGKRGD